MLAKDAFKNKQDEKVKELAEHVDTWLWEKRPAAVGLNEIHPAIVKKLTACLEDKRYDVQSTTYDSDTLLWRPLFILRTIII